MPTIAQIEEQIFVVEGFRVKLTPLLAKVKALPGYDFVVMAPQRWHISDWKTVRLAGYVTLLRSVVVLHGNGSPIKSDLQLGNIREREATDLLYQVISQRYERASIGLTTNLAFMNWTQIFPDAMTASVVVDRLVHHAAIFEFTGESYRLRSRQTAGRARKET